LSVGDCIAPYIKPAGEQKMIGDISG